MFSLRHRPAFPALGATLLACSLSTGAMAEIGPPTRIQESEYRALCRPLIDTIVLGGSVKNADPEIVRGNWRQNARCLFGFLERANLEIPPNEQKAEELVVITGALRAIIEFAASSDPRSTIEFLRQSDSLDAITTLAFSARSESFGLRYNATFVLANIIDNSSACVVVDHLYDPRLVETAGGINGRANLLGVLRTVASWADARNRERIAKVIQYTRQQIEGRPNVGESTKLLAELQERLGRLNNPSSPEASDCERYRPRFYRETA